MNILTLCKLQRPEDLTLEQDRVFLDLAKINRSLAISISLMHLAEHLL